MDLSVRATAYVTILMAMAILAGCAQARRPFAPPDVEHRVAELVKVVAGQVIGGMSPYDAAVELGEIGLKWQLPGYAIDALQKARVSRSEFYELFQIDLDWGVSGGLRIGVQDGAQAAFLMWELMEIGDEQKRMDLLWRTLCEPESGDGLRLFCIERLAQIPSPSAMTYLASAASLEGGGMWYVRGRAAIALAERMPQSREYVLALCSSGDPKVRMIAVHAIRRCDAPGAP